MHFASQLVKSLLPTTFWLVSVLIILDICTLVAISNLSSVRHRLAPSADEVGIPINSPVTSVADLRPPASR